MKEIFQRKTFPVSRKRFKPKTYASFYCAVIADCRATKPRVHYSEYRQERVIRR